MNSEIVQARRCIRPAMCEIPRACPALQNLYTYTRARPPSRTLVDPLDAFVTPLSKSTDFPTAVKAAAEAADKTKDLAAKAGRAAYVEGDRLKEEKIPDPGAWGVKTVLEAIFN